MIAVATTSLENSPVVGYICLLFSSGGWKIEMSPNAMSTNNVEYYQYKNQESNIYLLTDDVNLSIISEFWSPQDLEKNNSTFNWRERLSSMDRAEEYHPILCSYMMVLFVLGHRVDWTGLSLHLIIGHYIRPTKKFQWLILSEGLWPGFDDVGDRCATDYRWLFGHHQSKAPVLHAFRFCTCHYGMNIEWFGMTFTKTETLSSARVNWPARAPKPCRWERIIWFVVNWIDTRYTHIYHLIYGGDLHMVICSLGGVCS